MREYGYWEEFRRRRVSRRGLLGGAAVGAVGVAGLAAVGCGDDNKSGGSPTAKASSAASAAPSSAVQPKKGGTITYGLTTNPPTLDSAGTNNTAIYGTMMSAVAEELFSVSPNIKEDMVPRLATAMEPSPDFSSWTFTLRQGVKFHDGSDWNSDVLKMNEDRILDPSSALYDASVAAFSSQSRGNVDHVEAVDTYTAKYVLKHPDNDLAGTLTNSGRPRFFSQPALAKYGKDIGKNPVGTGPFQFSEWVQQQRVVFKRFDGYWGGAPNLDQLTFVVITDESARLASFLSGETLIDGGLTTTDATAVKQNNNSVLVSAPQIGPYVLILDTRDAPFSDKRVRQALSLATDRNALVQGTSSGFGSVANQYMTSLNPFYDKSLPPLEEDVQQAKTLLEQAGASNLKFPLLTFNTEPYKSFTQLLQQQWARAGITVTINQLETSQFLATAGKGTNSDTPAMATILLTQRPGQVASWLVSTAFAPAGKNRGYYSNSQFDSLEQQAATHSVADAKSYEQQAQKLALEEPSSIIPLYIIPELTGVSKKIQGVDWSQWKGWAYPLWQQFWMS